MFKKDVSDESLIHPDNKKVLIGTLILTIITLIAYFLSVRFTINSIESENINFGFYPALDIGILIGISALMVAGLSGFFISYFSNRNVRLYRNFNALYFELKYFLFPILLVFIVIIALSLFNVTHPKEIYIEDLIAKSSLNPEFYLMISPMVYISILYTHLAAFSIKTDFKEGFFDALLSKTLFGNFVFFIRQRISRFFDQREFGHLSNRTYIMYFLGFLIIFYLFIQVIINNSKFASLICFFITMYFLYSSLLMRQRADFLRIELEKICEGNYNMRIDKNFGSLNPLAESLDQVRAGLDMVVREEIKSSNAKTELITNVSHDLKTPLTSILSYSDLIRQEGLPEEKRDQYAEIIYQKSIRLKTLIDDLFEMSKVSTGNVEIDKQVINLPELFNQTLGEHIDSLEERGLEIIVSEFSGEVYAELDGEKTFRVFDNILVNIKKYALSDTRVYIDLSYDPVRQQMTFIFKNIANYEMTFDPNDLTRRFKRGDTSRNTEGSGLGLAIVKSLLEMQGASINMEVDGDLFKTKLIFPTIYKKALD